MKKEPGLVQIKKVVELFVRKQMPMKHVLKQVLRFFTFNLTKLDVQPAYTGMLLYSNPLAVEYSYCNL